MNATQTLLTIFPINLTITLKHKSPHIAQISSNQSLSLLSSEVLSYWITSWIFGDIFNLILPLLRNVITFLIGVVGVFASLVVADVVLIVVAVVVDLFSMLVYWKSLMLISFSWCYSSRNPISVVLSLLSPSLSSFFFPRSQSFSHALHRLSPVLFLLSHKALPCIHQKWLLSKL